MNALHAFLMFWSWFTSTHTCQVFAPDSVGTGNHIAYGGGCGEAFAYAQSTNLDVVWQGASQGAINFGHLIHVPS